MPDFNLELLDQDKVRLKKRRRLFLYVLVPLILLMIAALFFLRTGVYNIIYSTATNNKSYGFSSVITGFQTVGNLVEPYLPYYNNGYIKLIRADSREDLMVAEADFRESLKYNPPEKYLCAIYGNLSYSIELQGDLSSKEQQYQSALVFYNQAESLLFENGCANKDGRDSKDKKSQNAKERIDQKRREAVDAINNNTNDFNDSGKNNQDTDKEITESQLQEIKDQQEKVNNRAAGNPYQSHGPTGSSSSSGPNSRPSFGAPNF